MTEQIFEIFGYHIDYRAGGKYQGSVRIDSPDRDLMGYSGRTTYPLTSDVKTTKTVLKMGTTVTTECIPLCGKIIGDTLLDRINVLEKHYNKLPRK